MLTSGHEPQTQHRPAHHATGHQCPAGRFGETLAQGTPGLVSLGQHTPTRSLCFPKVESATWAAPDPKYPAHSQPAAQRNPKGSPTPSQDPEAEWKLKEALLK